MQRLHFLFLQFYKSCDKWKKEVDDNPDAILEKTKFEGTVEFKSMIQSVSERLGFETALSLGTRSYPTVNMFSWASFSSFLYLNFADDIDLMYNMCSFDKAWRPKKLSAWCAAFSQSDLEVSHPVKNLFLKAKNRTSKLCASSNSRFSSTVKTWNITTRMDTDTPSTMCKPAHPSKMFMIISGTQIIPIPFSVHMHKVPIYSITLLGALLRKFPTDPKESSTLPIPEPSSRVTLT